MDIVMVPLTHEHLTKIVNSNQLATTLGQSYFSDGSVSYCLMSECEPVFAGGIVNMQWHRGEAWMLPTPWFHSHVKTAFSYMLNVLPQLAVSGSFRRVQATCSTKVSPSLFRHLGFYSEGVLNAFGPNGETCYLYARLF